MTEPRSKPVNAGARWSKRARAARSRGLTRAGAVAGMAGPVAFTGAWIAGSLRQTEYPGAEIQLSGLAAPHARDPWIMLTGFLVLGGCMVAFGAALHDALGGGGRGLGRGGRALGGGGRAGLTPWLIQGAGLLTIAAGVLRRDHMLLTSGNVSWHNHAHDVVSAAIYADLVLAQGLLAVRFGRDSELLGPGSRAWRAWLAVSGISTAAVLVAFAADSSAAGAGILQRVAVSIPLAAVAAVAVRLLRAAVAQGSCDAPLAVTRG